MAESWLLLLVHVCSATPLAPMGTALLAELDRGHHIALRQVSGGLQVVLQHECVSPPTHRHGMLARALTVFAQGTSASHPDHILQFKAADTTCQPMAQVVPAPAQTSDPEAFLPGGVRFHAPGLAALVAVFPRPPPAPSELLLTVRSTVLVI